MSAKNHLIHNKSKVCRVRSEDARSLQSFR